MGHAIFHSYRHAQVELALAICNIFAQLTLGVDRKTERATLAGIRMVTQREWSNDSTVLDHPQDNVDEFFASSFAGFMSNLRGFTASVDRASKQDPERVTQAGQDLLVFLENVVAKALRGRSFSNRMRKMIAKSNTLEAQIAFSSIDSPGKLRRNADPGGLLALLAAM
jgi:hypothetical protein